MVACWPGGGFRAANGSFSEHFYFGGGDIFLAKLAPWSIGVPEVSQANIGLWPNPATGSVQISAEQSGVVSVTDIAGRQMYADAIARGIPLRIDVSTWPPGMYIVQHTLPDGSRRMARLMVE